MALIPQKSLLQLRDWNRTFWAEVAQDGNIPQSVKSMIYQHMQSLWVPDALAVVISPLHTGQNNQFLKQSAFDLGGIQYYYPSVAFWSAHATTSHPPDGSGCDPATHAAFLTATGQQGEFIYGVVKKDGSIVVQDLNGFINECAYFLAGASDGH